MSLPELICGPDPVEDHPESPGLHIWGWMSNHELDWLHAQAKTMNSIVEVGSLRGRSAYALAMGCRSTVHCIDPFDDVGGHCLPAFMENVGYLPNVHTIQGWSPAAAAEVPGMVDMVFIDGAHDLESVLADIDVWLPKTRKLICGHDYTHDYYPDVKRGVAMRFGDRTTNPAGAIWAVEL